MAHFEAKNTHSKLWSTITAVGCASGTAAPVPVPGSTLVCAEALLAPATASTTGMVFRMQRCQPPRDLDDHCQTTA